MTSTIVLGTALRGLGPLLLACAVLVWWGDRHDLVLAALGLAACGLWFLT